jgi:hypothetical protein
VALAGAVPVFMVLVLCAMTAMEHPDFADIGEAIREQLNGISTDTADATRKQLTITVALGHIAQRACEQLVGACDSSEAANNRRFRS